MAVVTDRNKIITIAPELTTLLTSIAQESKITVTTALNQASYTVTIDTLTAAYTSDTAATTLEIAAGLVNAINTAATSAVIATDNGDGTFNIEAKTAGTSYALTTGNYLSSIVVQTNYDYTVVYNQILTYVSLIVGSSFGSFQEMAQTYLAAHYFSLINTTGSGAGAGGNGNIQSQTVGSVSISYAQVTAAYASPFDATRYGREFANIRRMRKSTFRQVNS